MTSSTGVVRPRIGITMGDPAGVGPEIALRLLGQPLGVDYLSVVFGDAAVLKAAGQRLNLPLNGQVVTHEQWLGCGQRVDEPTIIDMSQITDMNSLAIGEVSASSGRASYRYVEAAIESALAGKIDALTTGPIHKEALNLAGIDLPGHTEILIERTKVKRACMMLTSDQITCSLVTTHVGLREVPSLLTQDRIEGVIQLSHDALSRLRGHDPQLVICGLNPHAGEHGLFGDGEEEAVIRPAADAARSRGIQIVGPLPPDTAFLPQLRAKTDGYICMYHDQGLIPVKALAFDTAVNVTLGLPIVRTSVDHGTAFDIAWQGKADITSLVHAVRLAIRLSCTE